MTGKVLTLFPWPQLSADNFGAFWQLYPRRVCKLEAQRAWARLTPQDRIEALRVMPLHVAAWERAGTEWHFVPHAATWINQRRFEDELEPAADFGQCDWNKNGNRDPGAPRCSERAIATKDNGHVYCEAHAVSLGLVKRKASA
jgi:hypothetical protein